MRSMPINCLRHVLPFGSPGLGRNSQYHCCGLCQARRAVVTSYAHIVTQTDWVEQHTCHVKFRGWIYCPWGNPCYPGDWKLHSDVVAVGRTSGDNCIGLRGERTMPAVLHAAWSEHSIGGRRISARVTAGSTLCFSSVGDKTTGQHAVICEFMKGARCLQPVYKPLSPLSSDGAGCQVLLSHQTVTAAGS